ncbi:hypothetical protein AB5N19_05111 [Seiridium cardinale]
MSLQPNFDSGTWRYAAITDRRIRSRNWGPADIAVSNAIFWTSKGWSGSESMLETALPYATRLPEGPMVRILSLEMLKTVIVFLQGIQAVTSIIGNFTSTGDYTTMDTVSGLFIPIGACGLLRLCAALWLTDDFHFTVPGDSPKQLQANSLKSYNTGLSTVSVDSFGYEPSEKLLPPMPEDFHIWYSRAFRFFFMIPIFGVSNFQSYFMPLLGYSYYPRSQKFLTRGPELTNLSMRVISDSGYGTDIVYLSPFVGIFGRKGVFTTTSWLLGVYYQSLLAPTVITFSYYFSVGPLRTNIIPCISKMWYKVYCSFCAVFTVVLIVIAAVETRKTFCGKFTSLTPDFDHPCATGQQKLINIGQSDGDMFAIAQNLTIYGQFVVANFTGMCLGVPDAVTQWQNASMD